MSDNNNIARSVRRAAWVSPKLLRLKAGRAEISVGVTPDVGIDHS
jgi:hypothetical protein